MNGCKNQSRYDLPYLASPGSLESRLSTKKSCHNDAIPYGTNHHTPVPTMLITWRTRPTNVTWELRVLLSNRTYSSLGLKEMLIFKMRAEGCNVEVFIAVGTWKIRAHVLISIHVIEIDVPICEPTAKLLNKQEMLETTNSNFQWPFFTSNYPSRNWQLYILLPADPQCGCSQTNATQLNGVKFVPKPLFTHKSLSLLVSRPFVKPNANFSTISRMKWQKMNHVLNMESERFQVCANCMSMSLHSILAYSLIW